MIFVTLGTHELEFTRLLNYLEKMDIDEEVIIQCGNTNFKSKKYKIVPFLTPDEFNEAMNKCDLLICHGGVGSILSALKRNKKVITVPRLSKYNEHNDDHQVEICKKFSKENYIINCLNYEELEYAIKNYKRIVLEPYIFNNSRLLNFIQSYIDNI